MEEMKDTFLEYRMAMRSRSAIVWGSIQLHRSKTGVSLRELTRRIGLPERSLEKYASGGSDYLSKATLEKVENWIGANK
jgi:hypothetical protein